MKLFIRIAFIIIFLLLVFILGLTLFRGYENTIDLVLRLVGKADEKEFAISLFSLNNFHILQGLLFVALILSVFLIYKSAAITYYVKQIFLYIWIAIKNVFADLKTKNALVILTIPLISSIYFACTVPISADEGVTYYLFTIKPFYNCLLFYPYPNNHILHSILTNVTEHLPFFGALFNLRLPAILASLLGWAIAYSFIKKYYSEKTAMFVVAITSMLFRSVYYSFMSRGYALIVVFFIISLCTAYNIVKNGNRKKDWMFFALSGILGCYAIPSFLYPYATVNILLLICNYRNIKMQIIYNAIAGLGTIILYVPIILINGIDSLFGNQFVTQEDMTRTQLLPELPAFMNEVFLDLLGIFYYPILIVMLITVVYLIIKRDKNKLILWLVFGLTPFLLLFAHNVIPFHRTFHYYGFIILFLIGVSWSSYINKIPKTPLYVFLLLFQVGGFIHFKMNIADAETFNTSAKIMNDKLIDENTTIDITSSYSRYNLLFEVISKGYEKENVKYSARHEMDIDADTINDVNYVIIDIDKDKTKHKKPFYSDLYHHVYKNDNLSIDE